MVYGCGCWFFNPQRFSMHLDSDHRLYHLLLNGFHSAAGNTFKAFQHHAHGAGYRCRRFLNRAKADWVIINDQRVD
jgi:hypothetical protein